MELTGERKRERGKMAWRWAACGRTAVVVGFAVEKKEGGRHGSVLERASERERTGARACMVPRGGDDLVSFFEK
jgi:hypothetical protein